MALIIFTLLEPVAWGLSLSVLMVGETMSLPCSLCAVLLATVGMMASVFHLAKPLRAPFSLRNMGSSWLSREILSVSCFWGVLLVWLTGVILQKTVLSLVGLMLACLTGGILMIVISRAYRIHSRPAWDGGESVFELCGVALGTGPALMVACSRDPVFQIQTVALGLMATGLIVGVVAHLMRRRRLERSEGISVGSTIENYRHLWPQIRVCWTVNCAIVILAAFAVMLSLAASSIVVLALWMLVALAALAVQGFLRSIFYKIPVQRRYIVKLR